MLEVVGLLRVLFILYLFSISANAQISKPLVSTDNSTQTCNTTRMVFSPGALTCSGSVATVTTGGSSGSSLWVESPGNVGINTTQNVGIGTLTPIEQLDVNGTILTSNLYLPPTPNGSPITGQVFIGSSSENGYNSPLEITNTTGGFAGNYLSAIGPNMGFNIYASGTNQMVLGLTSSGLVSGAGWSINGNTTIGDNLFVPNGNLGIGSIAPGAALDVQGTVRSQGLTITTADGYFQGVATSKTSSPLGTSVSLPSYIYQRATAPSNYTHASIMIGNELWAGTEGENIYTITNPDSNTPTIGDLYTGSYPFYQVTYIGTGTGNFGNKTGLTPNGNLYFITSNNLVRVTTSSGTVTTMTISGGTLIPGGKASIDTDGTYLYVLSYSNPSVIYKLSISGTTATIVSSVTWTGKSDGHMIRYDPVSGYLYVTTDNGYVGQFTTSLSLVTALNPGGTFTDDSAILNGYLWLGRESSTILKCAIPAMTCSSVTDSNNSYGIYTDGTNIFNMSSNSYIDIYLNGAADPYSFSVSETPSELWITQGGNFIFPAWGNGVTDIDWVRFSSTINLGIGQVPPTDALDVAGNAAVYGSLNTGSSITMGSLYNAGGEYVWADNTGKLQVNGNLGISVNNSNNVTTLGDLGCIGECTNETIDTNNGLFTFSNGDILINSPGTGGTITTNNSSPYGDNSTLQIQNPDAGGGTGEGAVLNVSGNSSITGQMTGVRMWNSDDYNCSSQPCVWQLQDYNDGHFAYDLYSVGDAFDLNTDLSSFFHGPLRLGQNSDDGSGAAIQSITTEQDTSVPGISVSGQYEPVQRFSINCDTATWGNPANCYTGFQIYNESGLLGELTGLSNYHYVPNVYAFTAWQGNFDLTNRGSGNVVLETGGLGPGYEGLAVQQGTNNVLLYHNVGIGTSAPTGKLEIEGGNVGIDTAFTSSNALSVMGGNVGIGTWNSSNIFEIGARKFDVQTAGNVGIGSTAPGQLLDVQGTVRSLGFSAGSNCFYYCNGGIDVGVISRGSSCLCPSGSCVATNICSN